MDPFFLRNRLSSWLDQELPPSEQGRIQQALENDLVLRQEAEAFSEKVKRIRALRVEAPEALEQLVNRPAPPAAIPWGAALVGGGILAFLSGVLWAWSPAQTPIDAAAEAPAAAAEAPVVEAPTEAPVETVAIAPTPVETVAPAKPRIPTQDIPISDSKITVINTPPPGMTTIPSRPSTLSSSNPRRRSSLQVVIPKEFVEDPDATEWVEDDLPATSAAAPAAPQPYRFRLVPSDSDKVLGQLAALTGRLGGRFLNTSGGVKAPYPMDPETTERVQLQVSAANVEVLLQNLSSCGTVSPLSQPSEPPVAGMVGVFVEVTAP